VTRDAASIGAGLAPVRDARPIVPGARIHVVGAAGAGASAAALLAAAAGGAVSGCDAGGPSPYTEAFKDAGIALVTGHDEAHVRDTPRPDRLAVTKALTAIDPDHPELRAARELHIPLEPWQQLIADAAAGRTLVAVAGTHGKSTTAGWLVHVLVEAGWDPSAFVALLPAMLTGGTSATARTGRGEVFVVEADEYAGNFDPYRPAITVLTSIEWDHPDVFADDEAVRRAFARWLAKMADGTTVVANVGDPGVAAVVSRLEQAGLTLLAVALTGTTEQDGPGLRGAILHAGSEGTTLSVAGLDPDGADIEIRLPTAGRHNAVNALGVAGAAKALGVPTVDIVRGLETFPGVGRRLERKGQSAGVVVYDDYGHHPTAIRATIDAVRQREPERRVWAVYEPLTYHRTAALIGEFAASLATADAVVIADIWAGRDPDTTIASAAGLADAISAVRPDIPVAAPGSVDATSEWLARTVRAGDVVLVMGGGHSYRIGTDLLGRLDREAAPR
jgi:UDP-N-acetylmuramate--alanine ligase